MQTGVLITGATEVLGRAIVKSAADAGLPGGRAVGCGAIPPAGKRQVLDRRLARR
jgi:NAD(P)-dependent dehydrogenase (short-subunit alcohol dehydrogenase family)